MGDITDGECLSAGSIRRILTLLTPYLSFKEAFFHTSITGDIDDPLKYLHKHGMCRDACVWEEDADADAADPDADAEDLAGGDLACRLFYDETWTSGPVTSPEKLVLRGGGGGTPVKSAAADSTDSETDFPLRTCSTRFGHTGYSRTGRRSSSYSASSIAAGTSWIEGEEEGDVGVLSRHIELFMRILPSVEEYLSRSCSCGGCSSPSTCTAIPEGTILMGQKDLQPGPSPWSSALVGSGSSVSSFGDHVRNEAADLILESPRLVRTRSDDWLDIFEVEQLLSVRNNGKYLGLLEFPTDDVGEHIMLWTFGGNDSSSAAPLLDLTQATNNSITHQTHPNLTEGLLVYLNLMLNHRTSNSSTCCSAITATAAAGDRQAGAGDNKNNTITFLLSQVLTVDVEPPQEEVTLKVWLALTSSTRHTLSRVALIKIDDL